MFTSSGEKSEARFKCYGIPLKGSKLLVLTEEEKNVALLYISIAIHLIVHSWKCNHRTDREPKPRVLHNSLFDNLCIAVRQHTGMNFDISK